MYIRFQACTYTVSLHAALPQSQGRPLRLWTDPRFTASRLRVEQSLHLHVGACDKEQATLRAGEPFSRGRETDRVNIVRAADGRAVSINPEQKRSFKCQPLER